MADAETEIDPDDDDIVVPVPDDPAVTTTTAATGTGGVSVPASSPLAAPPAGRKQKFVRIPQSALAERIDRGAAAIVKKRLGITLEEAEKIVKAAGTQTTAAETADQAVGKLQEELEKNRRLVAAANSQVEQLQKKNARDIQRLKDRNVETELRYMAASVGIKETDFALHLFAKAASAGTAEDPKEYFTKLKTTHKYLWEEPTADATPTATDPPVVLATTAPPESTAPGEAKPKPAVTTTAPTPVDVDKMSPTEFAEHRRRQYQFSS